MLSNPYAESSGGSSADAIDVEREQIADGVGVLGAVQAVEQPAARDSASPRPRDRGSSSDTRRAPSRVSAIGLRRALRRHHADAHLPDDLLPDVRRCDGRRNIDFVEREPAGLGAVVMTRDAVFGDDGAVIGGGSRTRSLARSERDACDCQESRRAPPGDCASMFPARAALSAIDSPDSRPGRVSAAGTVVFTEKGNRVLVKSPLKTGSKPSANIRRIAGGKISPDRGIPGHAGARIQRRARA